MKHSNKTCYFRLNITLNDRFLFKQVKLQINYFCKFVQPEHNCSIIYQIIPKGGFFIAFFNSAVGVLQTLVIALGAGLGIWGVINLLEGYGNDNPGAKSQGMKHYMPE